MSSVSRPVTKSRFQFVFVAMAITSAAGCPSMTAIRTKVRAVSVRRTENGGVANLRGLLRRSLPVERAHQEAMRCLARATAT
jgi:hypothetical protein